MSDDPIKNIIQQIRQLDIQSKDLNTRRVALVHELETTIDISNRVERNQSTDTVLFRHGERISITNRVTPARGTVVTIEDRRGTVTKQKKTDKGKVKVYFRTDNGVHTHRLENNVCRVSKKCTYEIQVRAEQERAAEHQFRTSVAKSTQASIFDEFRPHTVVPQSPSKHD